ncbi:MAG: HEAT repeat domain-containing protein [Desulfamplus sp.]|nr:HEAT repeat domain-containing protein [Desulfamplus sp.]MBF0240876.1 HEAT repeat domain-containing protein [Desulfamplus sp.]MBF0388971.1 HEAT repeat domain-containing protein [Desulfamplus sp.]
MPDRENRRTGVVGFTAKVLNEAGSAIVDLYDLGAGALGCIVNFSKETTSKFSSKTKTIGKKKADSTSSSDKAKIIKERIKAKEGKLKEIYQEIGKEESKTKTSSGADSDPEVLDNIKKLTSDVKEFEEQISRLEEKASLIKKEKAEAQDKKGKAKDKQKQPLGRKHDTKALTVEEAVQSAIESALKSGKFSSISEKSKFEKVANDLLSEEYEVRILAANELAKMKNEAAVPVLTESVKAGDPNLTSEIINALITIGSVDSVPLFKEMVTDKNYRIRLACLRGLYKLAEEDDEALQMLVNAVKDEHSDVRKCAITFIGWKDNAESVPSLVNALKDDNDDVRKTALDALATIRDKATVLPVIRVLADKDETIREKALDTLKMITGEQIPFDMDASKEDRSIAVDSLIDWWQKKRIGEGEIFMPSIDEVGEIPDTLQQSNNIDPKENL